MIYVVPMLAAVGFVAASLFDDSTTKRLEDDSYKDYKDDGDSEQHIRINNYMKVWEVIHEDTTSGGIATSMGGGNGFVNGGPGTIQRKKKKKTEDSNSPVASDDNKMIRRNP